ncbi:hypothetical protein LCGC14_2307930 [marine sediment metagenome]|uniref:Uncharacterized protein n=1 Tax=marine sediment metagenome TaxID=412755 RepID=A0A0F9D907_9ZZZZ
MSVFICTPAKKANLKEFKTAKEAIKWAGENPEKVEKSDSGYEILKSHSKVFHIENVTQAKIVFVEEVVDEKK